MSAGLRNVERSGPLDPRGHDDGEEAANQVAQREHRGKHGDGANSIHAISVSFGRCSRRGCRQRPFVVACQHDRAAALDFLADFGQHAQAGSSGKINSVREPSLIIPNLLAPRRPRSPLRKLQTIRRAIRPAICRTTSRRCGGSSSSRPIHRFSLRDRALGIQGVEKLRRASSAAESPAHRPARG